MPPVRKRDCRSLGAFYIDKMAGTLCLIGCPAACTAPPALVRFFHQSLLSDPQDFSLICSSDSAPVSFAIPFCTALSTSSIQVDYAWDTRHHDSAPRAEPNLPNMVLVSESFGQENEQEFKQRISRQMEIPAKGVTVVLVCEEIIEEITEMCELEEDMSALMFRQNGKSREIMLSLYATREQVREIESKALQMRPKPKFPAPFTFPQAGLSSFKAAVLKAISDTSPPTQLSEEDRAELETRITEEANSVISTLKASYNAALQRTAVESQQALIELQSKYEANNAEVMSKLAQLREDQRLLHSVLEDLENLVSKLPDTAKEVETIRAKLATYEFTNREVLRIIENQPRPKAGSLPITVTNLRDSENQAEDCHIVSLRSAKQSAIEGATLVLQSQASERRELATELRIVPGESEVKVHLPEEATGQLKLFVTKVVSDVLSVEVRDSKPVPVPVFAAKFGTLPKPNFNKFQPISKPGARDLKSAEERKVEEPKPFPPFVPMAAKSPAKLGPRPFIFPQKPGNGGDFETAAGPTAEKPAPLPKALSKAEEPFAPSQSEGSILKFGLKPFVTGFQPVSAAKPVFPSPVLGRFAPRPPQSETVAREAKAVQPELSGEVSLPKSGKDSAPQPVIEEKPVPAASSPDQPKPGSLLLPAASEVKPNPVEAQPAVRPKPLFPSPFKSSFPVVKPSVPNAEASQASSQPGTSDRPTQVREGNAQFKLAPNFRYKPDKHFPAFKSPPQAEAVQSESSTEVPPPAPPSNSSGEVIPRAETQPQQPSSREQSQKQFRPVPFPSMPSSGKSSDKLEVASGTEANPPVPKIAEKKPGLPKFGTAPFAPNPFKSGLPPSPFNNPQSKPSPPHNDAPSVPAKPPLPELTPEQQAKIASVREVVSEGFSSDMERRLIDLLRSPQGQSLSQQDLINEVFSW